MYGFTAGTPDHEGPAGLCCRCGVGRDRGRRTNVTPISPAGQRLFRVRLGPLASVEEADQALERVTKRGYPGSRIVVE